MRLLLTTDTVGGVWTFTRELTLELLQLGHAVALVSFGRPPSRDQREWCSTMHAAHRDSFCFEACQAPLEWMETNEEAYTGGQSVLLRVAAEFSPDLLHSNQFCFGRLPLTLPRLVTAHSDVLSWAEACCPDGLAASRWLTTYCTLSQQGLLAADAVTAPTCWMLTALGRHFELPGSQHVIFNGRALPEHQQPAAPERQLQAVSVGRFWDEAKNLRLLGGLNSPFPILIAGNDKLDTSDGPSSGPEVLSTSASVHALGFLCEQQLLDLFRSSSLYIAAAVYEPFGLAPLEAALCGCAVLANDIASLREVWADAALYFSGGASLEKLLQQLSCSPDLLAAVQARSLHRARQLTAKRMTSSYLALYESLLSQRRSHPQTSGPPVAQPEAPPATERMEPWPAAPRFAKSVSDRSAAAEGGSGEWVT